MDQYFNEAILALIEFCSTPPSTQFDIVKNMDQLVDKGMTEAILGVNLENSTAKYTMAAEHRHLIGMKADSEIPKTFMQAIQGKNTVHWMGAATGKAEQDILEEKGVF